MDLKNFNLQAMLKEVGIEDKYEYYIFCDGSGTGWDYPIGFASFIWDKVGELGYLSKGSMSYGTNNYAEIMPILTSLSKIRKLDGNNCEMARTDIAIISDSKVSVDTINGINSPDMNSPELWAGISYFKEPLYKLTAFHIERNSNELAKLMDKLAGEMRKTLL